MSILLSMPAPPATTPIGLQVTHTAKVLTRAFDEALAEAGGSLPVWLVLVSLKSQRHGMQRDLAEAVGIEGPTLTHHLNRMEAVGLITRTRDPANRRVHLVELTDEGEAAFQRMRRSATTFDRRLRHGLDAQEIDLLSTLLRRLRENVAVATPTEVGP
jgi:MarR family transcriptional regulator for hemolysin